MSPHFRMVLSTVHTLGRPTRVDRRSTCQASTRRNGQYTSCGGRTTLGAEKLRVMADVLRPERSHREEQRGCVALTEGPPMFVQTNSIR